VGRTRWSYIETARIEDKEKEREERYGRRKGKKKFRMMSSE
jgi:hypothetical protein